MQYGEIWQLGEHKLMCGDATNSEDINRLVDSEHVDLILTDPPYGVKTHGNYNFKEDGRHYPRRPNKAIRYVNVIGDKSTDTAHKHYDIVKDMCDIIYWGGNYFTEFLPPSKCWLVWNKNQTLWNHSDCELAWTNIKGCIKHYEQTWSGACRAGSLKLNPRPCVHPTQKPVELHARILEDFSKENDIILDCFGGSGTTLIACEVTGRRCLMMEISPEYCEIIIKRYRELMPMKEIKQIR